MSNEAFAAFMAATDYETEAETLGSSFVFQGSPTGTGPAVAAAPWWVPAEADWAHPEGPNSTIAGNFITYHPFMIQQAFHSLSLIRLSLYSHT